MVVNVLSVPPATKAGQVLARGDVELVGVGELYRTEMEAAGTDTEDAAARGA
jgi:hypothetical protein